jgi:DNA-binding NarL/FixJ family response regulator
MPRKPSPVNPSPKKQVLLVDDHPMVCERLAQLINDTGDLIVCGVASTAAQALEAVERLRPDIALVDLNLKGSSGMELLKNLRALHSGLPVLVLSMHEESSFAERVLRAGAKGYISKQEDTERVLAAVRRVLHGGIYLSEATSARLLEKTAGGKPAAIESPLNVLSDRELEVFQMIGQGYETRRIAEELHLDAKSVETYRSRIREKLGLQSMTELVVCAAQWVQDEGSK